MTLNIGPARSDASDGSVAADGGRTESGERQAGGSAPSRRLVGEAVTELSAWNPREFIAAFQRWHHGSVSLVHLNVLSLLELNGPTSMSKLAEALDISVASMTGVIDRMEKRGLVERRHDDEDRRVVLVAPAAGGKAIFTDIDARRRAGLTKLLGRLNDDELTGLLRGHRALRAARAAEAAARDAEPRG